jgi:hypothetical protein
MNLQDLLEALAASLHHLAEQGGRALCPRPSPMSVWQLPIRRSFETREFGEREISITVIGVRAPSVGG